MRAAFYATSSSPKSIVRGCVKCNFVSRNLFTILTFEDVSRVLDGLALRLPDVVVVEDDGAVEQVERVPQVPVLVA